MIVVADSGPLHYLILLDQIDLLRTFYGDVLVPRPVFNELHAAGAPPRVREWFAAPPPWLRIVDVPTGAAESISATIDAGERAAIALAELMRADLLLIDDSAGRAEAKRRNLRVTGTLGVLRTAADARLLDVKSVIARLKSTNFYVDDDLLERVFGDRS